MSTPISTEDIASSDNIDFEEKEEHWNVYKLRDGTTLKIKLILVGVRRLKTHNPDGTPIYVISPQNVIRAIDIPRELMAKQKVSTFNPI